MKRTLVSAIAVLVAVSCYARDAVVVERSVMVPMRDAVQLATDIARPGRDGRFPVILSRTPYGKQLGGNARMARGGWAVAVQDVRGRYQSEGEFYPFVHDPEDGYDTIEWLAAQPTTSTIIQMPLSAALSGPQMYYSRYHNQRLASGYGTYLPVLFAARYPRLNDFPSTEALDLLADWEGGGIRYVLVDQVDVPLGDPLWSAIAAQDRLQPVITLEGVHVYEVR